MRNEPIDFIEVDYSLANRNVEEVILPLAIERKIGVIPALPFGRESLFRRVPGKPLPEWAKDIDATTWSHYFLKYIIGHPAVTVAIPGTRNPAHMRDNMGAAFGRLPDEAMRKRMIEYFDSVALPPAAGRGGRGG
jgi:aryl-alcohol dehydrogenase-like predicted oxidoreductase